MEIFWRESCNYLETLVTAHNVTLVKNIGCILRILLRDR